MRPHPGLRDAVQRPDAELDVFRRHVLLAQRGAQHERVEEQVLEHLAAVDALGGVHRPTGVRASALAAADLALSRWQSRWQPVQADRDSPGHVVRGWAGGRGGLGIRPVVQQEAAHGHPSGTGRQQGW